MTTTPRTFRAAAGAAALALSSCAAAPVEPSSHPPLGVPGPADRLANAVSDDGNVVVSMSEGGVSSLPYVADGTVVAVWAHAILVRSEVGQLVLWVDPHTEITVDGNDAPLEAIRPGTPIRVAYGATYLATGLQAGEGATSDD
jgi:hypothetical protein